MVNGIIVIIIIVQLFYAKDYLIYKTNFVQLLYKIFMCFSPKYN